MKVSKGEFTRFSTGGRMQLLLLYGTAVMQMHLPQHSLIIYKIFKYYVAVIKSTAPGHPICSVEPLTGNLPAFFRNRAGLL